MRALRPARDAAGLDHVAEQAEIGKIEPHGHPSSIAKEAYAKSSLKADYYKSYSY